MAKIIQAQLGAFRSVFYYRLPDTVSCNRGDCVILKVDRGTEFGHVVSEARVLDPKQKDPKQKSEGAYGDVLRVATAEDTAQIEKNKEKAQEVLDVCIKKLSERSLGMQLVDAEYTFDAKKVIVFFTADDRVDFRALVKDLARIFKVRIELKQIGVRDKAKMTGGCGVCGRVLCCMSYLKGFHPLSIKMAKEQCLPLNDSKIAGTCGRIKCCMAYEFAVYRQYAKSLPRLGEKITTPEGKGRVVHVNILKRHVSVDLGEGKIKKMSFAQDT